MNAAKSNFIRLLVIIITLLGIVACNSGPEIVDVDIDTVATDDDEPVQSNTDTTSEEPETEGEGEVADATEPTATRIELWFHADVEGQEGEPILNAIESFNEQQDEYEIEAARLPEGNYTQHVNDAALSGNLPCLLDFDGPLLYNFAWNGYLRPIDEYASEELLADFLPSIINQGTFNNQLYSLGQFDSGLGIYANKSYLEQAGIRIPTFAEPWDLVEFEDALEKLTALDSVEHALDIKYNYGAGEWFTYGFSPIVQSFGGDLIDRTDYQSASGVLDGPEAVAAMTAFQKWVDNGWVNTDAENDDSFYGTNTTALAWVGHWMYPTHQEALGDNLLVLPMPKLGEQAVTGMGSWNWGITSTCPDPAGAWAFLEYLMTPEHVAAMSKATGAVPSLFSVLEESEVFGSEGPLYVYVQQLNSERAVQRPNTPAYAAITTAFAEATNNIIAGADVQTELTAAAQAIDKDIEEHNGYPLD